MNMTGLYHQVHLQHGSLVIFRRRRRRRIGVETRRISIRNRDGRIADVEVRRSIVITLFGKILHALPVSRATFAGGSLATGADEVQVE
jgi:hypothetical protein